LAIILLFFLEALLVSYNLAEVFVPSPIQTWFIVLFCTVLINQKFGYKVYTIISFLIGLLVFTSFFKGSIEVVNNYIQNTLLFDENILCNPAIFAISSWIGFSLGKVFTRKISNKEMLTAAGLSLVFSFIARYFAPAYRANPLSSYEYEYYWAYILEGSICVWFIIFSVLMMAKYLEDNNMAVNLKVFNYISMNSLFIFLFHQIYFIFMAIPFRLALDPVFGPIENNAMMGHTSVVFYLLLFYFLKEKVFKPAKL
jgi:hypothetical protein